MSDFEDDIDDQLLELAGATEKKKKRRRPSNSNGTSNSAGGSGGGGGSGGSKKRKAERMEIESEKEPVESEDEGEDPYPLEGKYKDETDRRELLAMTEFNRERILEERSEQKQRLQNARALADMVKQQQRGNGGGVAPGDDSVSRAAKRQHTARGVTKEKTQRLDELKAKRKAKDDKKRSKVHNSPSQRQDRSSSPQDMDISDSESEDGQISKFEQEEERFLNLTSGIDSRSGKGRAGGKDKEDNLDVPCTMADLETCRLTRDEIVKHYVKPWFQEYITGAWVRYLIGQETGGSPVYRICQINNLAPDPVKPYKVNDKAMNQAFELKHGKSLKIFSMDKVSNGPFIEKEFERLTKTFSTEDVKMPTKRAVENKVTQMQKLVTQPMTESDITAMLARKSQLQLSRPTGMSTMERSRLNQARTLAQRRNDWNEVAEIDAKLAEEAARTSEQQSARSDTVQDMLAKVNERNRKANMEAVRNAEMAEAEKKKKERKLLAQNGGRSTPVDPSARLKTVPRLFNSNTPVTRPGTPVTAPPAVSMPLAPLRKNSSFEASLIDSVEIDLGDF